MLQMRRKESNWRRCNNDETTMKNGPIVKEK
jgi:hypothetical protein